VHVFVSVKVNAEPHFGGLETIAGVRIANKSGSRAFLPGQECLQKNHLLCAPLVLARRFCNLEPIPALAVGVPSRRLVGLSFELN
jgi:hypothetical protein